MTPTASKSPFVYPLQFDALEEFCHPSERHQCGRPAFYEGQALVANGYMALRVDRGLWDAKSFEDAPPGFFTRVLGLPWAKDLSAVPAGDWRAMDAVRAILFKRGPLALWLNGRPSPTPVVRVGGHFLARLSHLQLIARLPRCEVVPPRGMLLDGQPLHFRFSGGRGMIAEDKRLTESSLAIFSPQRCPIDGGSIPRNTGPLVLPKKPPYWKQFEPTD